jgi:hypothetical protein
MVVTNPEHDLTVWLKTTAYDLITGYDWNGFNTTVQIVRSCNLTQMFYWACNNTGRNLYGYHDWHEMQTMRYFLQTAPYNSMYACESVKFFASILPEEYIPFGVPAPVMKPFAWEPGDFAVHLSALSLPRRIELARQYSELAKV